MACSASRACWTSCSGRFGLLLPPISVGLLMALRLANIAVGRHFTAYWPYLAALFVGLLLLILLPGDHALPTRRAGVIR